MKEKYYSVDSVDRAAARFLAEVNQFRKRHPLRLKKNRCALLVIDMQDYFIDKNSHACVPSAEAIIPRIKRLQDEFLSHNRPVIQTRHVNNPDKAGQMLNWWGELITDDNPLSKINKRLYDDSAMVITKPQYDAFLDSELESILKNKKIEQLVVTGVMTHLCCESTARSAFMRGFEVLFTIDGTATYNENFHRATLLNLSHGFAQPVLTGEIIDLLVQSNEV